jgi:chromosomal replication initiator protein
MGVFNADLTDYQKDGLVSSVREALKSEFGNNIYNVWLKNIDFVVMGEFEIVLSLPNEFVRDYVRREYLNGVSKKMGGETVWLRKGIREVLLKLFPKLLSLDLIVKNRTDDGNDKRNIDDVKNKENKENKVVSVSENDNLYNVGIDLNKNFTFENFVVGNSNKLAHETAKLLSVSGTVENSLNPLFLYGSVGIGKTHLCQAMAWKMREIFPNKNIIYISAEKFMYLFVQSCKNQDINSFKKKFRNVDCLIIDDLQFIIGKETTQKEFFYTFETLTNENKQVVLACDRSPTNLVGLDEKLKSRLNGGVIINIQNNDRELTGNIVRKKCECLNLTINADLMEYIADNMISDTRQLEGFLKRIQMNENIMGIKVTKDVVNDMLASSGDTVRSKATLDGVLDEVCKYFAIDINDLKSESRLRSLVVPRHIAMYLGKELTGKSYPEVARCFNKKNHAIVLYAHGKIKKKIENNNEIREYVEEIKNKIGTV